MIVAAESWGRPLALSAMLVGRARERVRLREALAAAFAGRGNLVLIGGDPGIGKTELVQALAREAAERGALVHVCQCYDLTQTTSYSVWRELLANWSPPHSPGGPVVLAQRNGNPSASTILDGPQRGVVEVDRLDRFASVRDFLSAEAANRPLCLVLEDLHWADESSLELLRFLGRALPSAPILVIGTYRDDEVTPGHPLYRLLPLLTREGGVTRLDLAPLDDEAVRTLLWARYSLAPDDEARLVAALHARAEGNPLFTEEFLRAAEDAGVLRHAGELSGADRAWSVGDLAAIPLPPLLKQMIDGRVARLGPEAARLLAIAATIGREVPIDLWGRVAGVDDEVILALVERAVEARLVVETPDGRRMRFRQPLVREVLYEGLSAARRRIWHLRAGEALAATRAELEPRAVADHFRQAGDARAVTWLIRAGDRALRFNNWTTAATHFGDAAAFLRASGEDEATRGWLLYRLACLSRYRDPVTGLAILREAEVIASERQDCLLATLVASGRGMLRVFAGQLHWAITELEEATRAWGELPDEEHERLRAMQGEQSGQPPWGTLAAVLASVGRYREARVLAERVAVEPLARTFHVLDGSQAGNANVALGLVHTASGSLDEARVAYGRARATYRAAGHHLMVGALAARELLAVLRYATDDLATRVRLADEAEEALSRAGDLGGGIQPRFARLPLLALEGRWSEAMQLAEGASLPLRVLVPVSGIAIGPIARAQGDLATAWRLVGEMLPAGLATPPGDASFLDALGLIQLAVGLAHDADDVIAMRSWLDTFDRWLAWGDAASETGETSAPDGAFGSGDSLLEWARYHRAMGDLGEARSRAEAALAYAAAPRQPLVLLAAARFLGELDTAAGSFDAASAHLDAALALADACAAPFERAQVLMARAELQLARIEADATSAVDPALARSARLALDEVRAICTPIGAAPALARANVIAARLAAAESAGAAPAPPAVPRPPGTGELPPVPTIVADPGTAPMPGLALKRGAAAPPAVEWLTPRELEVLRLIAGGLSNREIAAKLFLSVRTAERHIANIYKKIGAHSKADATAFAFSKGLL
jgi:DNA-binding CsgD family transcriptional regulator